MRDVRNINVDRGPIRRRGARAGVVAGSIVFVVLIIIGVSLCSLAYPARVADR